MIAEERLSTIRDLLKHRDYISTQELARLLNVTPTTVRRDCEELDKKGEAIRVHGGIKRKKKRQVLSNRGELTMQERLDIHAPEKTAVARKAASLVKDGDCIFLDGGTSILPLANALHGKKIKIVTHNQLIAQEFDDDGAELFLLGGKFIPQYSMSAGPLTLGELEKFNFDYAFISCAGTDPATQQVYTAEMDTMAVKQKAMDQADKKYLLIDSSKFEVKGFCSFLSSSDFDGVICNSSQEIPEEELPDNYILVDAWTGDASLNRPV